MGGVLRRVHPEPLECKTSHEIVNENDKEDSVLLGIVGLCEVESDAVVLEGRRSALQREEAGHGLEVFWVYGFVFGFFVRAIQVGV